MEEGFARLDKLKRQAEQLEAEIVRKREELYKTDNIHEDKLARIVSELNRLKLWDLFYATIEKWWMHGGYDDDDDGESSGDETYHLKLACSWL